MSSESDNEKVSEKTPSVSLERDRTQPTIPAKPKKKLSEKQLEVLAGARAKRLENCRKAKELKENPPAPVLRKKKPTKRTVVHVPPPEESSSSEEEIVYVHAPRRKKAAAKKKKKRVVVQKPPSSSSEESSSDDEPTYARQSNPYQGMRWV